MNDPTLALAILAEPTVENLSRLAQEQNFDDEIVRIVGFTDRQLLDYTGTPGPPQFRSLMAAYRLIPKDWVLDFVVECGLHVFPIVKEAYPESDVVVEFERLSNLPAEQFRLELPQLKEQLSSLCIKCNSDCSAAERAIFSELGYVPIEQGEAVGRIIGAVNLLSIVCTIVAKQDSPKFFRNVDAMMTSLMLVYPNASDELGKWVVSCLRRIVEARHAE